MNSEHTSVELGANEISVNEKGEIHLLTDSESITIGDIQSLYELEIYEDGKYVNDNGFVVHLERLIDNLVVTDAMARNLKRSSDKKYDEDDNLTIRMQVLHYVVSLVAESADGTDKDWVLQS